jgi:hypothetical protein
LENPSTNWIQAKGFGNTPLMRKMANYLRIVGQIKNGHYAIKGCRHNSPSRLEWDGLVKKPAAGSKIKTLFHL